MHHEIPEFAHHKLDVYNLATDLAVDCDAICERLPKARKRIVDQLSPASMAIPLLIGEAANRCTTGRKRQRFSEARGETGEVAVALEFLLRLNLVPAREAKALLERTARIGRMLSGLIKLHSD
jgi:four helix bundle protein